MKRFSAVLAAGLAVALAAAGGCTADSGSSTRGPAGPVSAYSIALDADSSAPAPEVPGAKRGGVITVLSPFDYQSIDPAQIGGDNEVVLADLLYRTLTTTRQTESGSLEVVGDLATDAGESSDGGRTWKYTLREGIKYEDGQPVTAKDVAHGVARAYAPELQLGNRRLQRWLAGSDEYNKDYKGPYTQGPTPPGVELPDDRTIVFKFDRPQPYLPFVAGSLTTAPVPPAKDTRANYGNKPVATGPYRVETYARGQRMVLARNTNWDAKTDPVRHQYADGFDFRLSVTPLQISERLIADRGADQLATTWWSVSPELVPRVEADPKIRARVTEGLTGNVQYMYINTSRVKDVNVRRALNLAMDRQSFVKVQGGPALSRPATTLLSPLIPGHQRYNAYDGGPTGDPEQAKRLLGGKTVTLTLAAGTTALSQRRAATIRTALQRAGFEISLQSVDSQFYYATVSKRGNPYDLVLGGTSALWPDGGAAMHNSWDGRQIRDQGHENLSFFDEPAINERMDELDKETDPDKAATAWAELDEQIMEEYAPAVPLTYFGSYSLSGSKVGGIYLSTAANLPALRNAHVK